jgi:3-hydroxybutyryl-CoA dehydrogenase
MPIHTIALIGAGIPGRAIAQISLRAGYRTVLEDFSNSTLEAAMDHVRDSFGQSLDQAVFDQLRNLSICTGVENAIRDAHLIIETAADEMETKLELFTIFDKFARPNAIFATTSAAHPIAEIADMTSCPDRCVTLRFSPAEDPRRLAIIPGPQTSSETIQACIEFAQQLKIQLDPPPSGSDTQQGTNNREA